MDTLDLVIIFCVLIGTMAFTLVVAILCWAMRYDRQNRATFIANNNSSTTNNNKDVKQQQSSDDMDGSSSDVDYMSSVMPEHDPYKRSDGNKDSTGKSHGGSSSSKRKQNKYPSEIGMDDYLGYPESVISEDFGGGSTGGFQSTGRLTVDSIASGYVNSSRAGGFTSNDGVESVSSVDASTYGYSLDGASLATPMIPDISRLDSVDSNNRTFSGGSGVGAASYYSVEDHHGGGQGTEEGTVSHREDDRQRGDEEEGELNELEGTTSSNQVFEENWADNEPMDPRSAAQPVKEDKYSYGGDVSDKDVNAITSNTDPNDTQDVNRNVQFSNNEEGTDVVYVGDVTSLGVISLGADDESRKSLDEEDAEDAAEERFLAKAEDGTKTDPFDNNPDKYKATAVVRSPAGRAAVERNHKTNSGGVRPTQSKRRGGGEDVDDYGVGADYAADLGDFYEGDSNLDYYRDPPGKVPGRAMDDDDDE